ncbi:MAG: DUF4430 domain-containing protein [Clostridia bacterium]|nr:DUF4430 domain-containing protein [Clostridia bacterium]
MKTTLKKRVLSAILCIVLVAAVALFTTSCNDNKKEAPETTTALQAEVKVLGEGKNEFSFTVSDIDGNVSEFEIHTDKKIVGEALLDLELIKGDEGPYGLYVKEVNGISADFDKDGVYWAFYVNGEYATSGVDMTEIEDGKVYSFKVEKG